MKILAIGAHPDDVELGCFATLTKLHKEGHEIHILVCTNGEAGLVDETSIQRRLDEARESAALINAKIYFAGNLTVHKGQTAFIQSPNIFTELELWSAFAKLIIFVLAWDAAGVLICEVFKKIYDSDHHKK